MLETIDEQTPAHVLEHAVRLRARAISNAGSIDSALASGTLNHMVDVTLSEALVLGLLKQKIRKYFSIFGHGSTDLANMLRIYEEEGVTRTLNCRNEVAMAHAATALSWQYGETAAVVTSVGPGALQALAGSLASASNGVGVYHIYGDETTFGEGYNMQQIPKQQQGLFGQMTAMMGQSYVLHTPQAIRDCLRRGTACVHHPFKAGPFYVLLPLNTQPSRLQLNLATLPERSPSPVLVHDRIDDYENAVQLIARSERPVIKAGGGTRGQERVICEIAERVGACVVSSPGSTGILPDDHPQYMHVGGSKGSISGNYAMEHADLLIAIGTRAVCQADCSGVGYPQCEAVININGDLSDVMHYANTIGLAGDISAVSRKLLDTMTRSNVITAGARDQWSRDCLKKKNEWIAFKNTRFQTPPLMDAVWQREVLTQPAAIKVACNHASSCSAVKYFDAGDVQANGFQIVEDNTTSDTFTESGASYMGFAVSALLASAAADNPRYGIAFTGDGSFMMNPQILIDAVEHAVKGMIVLFDNRRMAAISGLQLEQYDAEFATGDSVAVDYVRLATAVSGVEAWFGGYSVESLTIALEEASNHKGLSLVHVPIYSGPDPLGGMGAYGSWNVGNWVEDVQTRYLHQRI